MTKEIDLVTAFWTLVTRTSFLDGRLMLFLRKFFSCREFDIPEEFIADLADLTDFLGNDFSLTF